MSGHESVVDALVGVGESRQASELAVVDKAVAASGEYLMPVGLMAHVPYNAVVGRVENIVQGHGEFHRAHRRGEVTGVYRKPVDEELPYLLAHGGEFGLGQGSQVGRRLDARQQGVAFSVCCHSSHIFCTWAQK